MKTDGTNPPGQEIKGLIDINCHILPGMEDGPDDLREAAEMLRIAYDEGIRTIVATPPYNKKNPIMDGDKLDRIVEQLNIEAGRIDPYYKVYLGREIEYNDENHQKIISGQLDSMADSKYVMIRFQYDIDFETISEAIRDINMDGYIPIVADVEQYECLESDEDKVEELIQLGAYVQISAAAVVGGLGHDIKSFSRKLLKEELVHFVASDALDSEDKAPYLRECAEYIERKYGEDYMNELFYTNPKAVIENDDIDVSNNILKNESIDKLNKYIKEVLSEREYYILVQRYGLLGHEEMTQRQIAKILGISRSYVSRIEKRALDKLKKVLEF